MSKYKLKHNYHQIPIDDEYAISGYSEGVILRRKREKRKRNGEAEREWSNEAYCKDIGHALQIYLREKSVEDVTEIWQLVSKWEEIYRKCGEIGKGYWVKRTSMGR